MAIPNPQITVKKTDDFYYHLSPFNWFLGILLIFSGLSFFLFQILNPNQELVNYLSYLKIIKIFLMISGGALIVLGSDRLHNTISERVFYSLVCFLNILQVWIFWKAGDQLEIATNGVLAATLLIFLIYKFSDLAKIIFLINAWMIASGIVFYFWPDSLGVELLVYWVKNNQNLFAIIWFLAIFFLLFLSTRSLRGDKKTLLIFSIIIAIPSLVLSILALTSGMNDMALNGAVLSIFAFSLPIWLYVEPLGSLTRIKLLNAFSWWLIIIIAGTIFSFYIQSLFKIFLTNDLTDRVLNTANAIQSYLSDRELAVQGFQSSDELINLMSAPKKDPTAVEKKLKELYLASRKFLRIMAIDDTGKIIAVYPNDLTLINQDISNQNYFQNTKNSDQINISDFIQVQNAIALSYVSARLNKADGQFVGVISGIIDTADISDLLQNFKYDELTNFLVIDSKKNILFFPDHSQILNPAMAESSLGQVITIQGKTIEEYNFNQELSLRAFSPIKNYNWGVVVEQPFKSTTGGDRTIASVVFLTSIISAIGSLFIMLYIRRRTVIE